MKILEVRDKYAMVEIHEPIGRNSDAYKVKSLIQFADSEGIHGLLLDVRSFECDIPMGALYHFAHIELKNFGFDRRLQIAMLHEPTDRTHDFFVLVCHNAGYNIKAFHSDTKAWAWLGKGSV